jgi:hypothetical protein
MEKNMPGKIIYDGKSLLDNKTPIIAVAVNGNKSAPNSKTGDMLQTYILTKDIDPRLANKTGQDFGICGNCPHRGIPSTDPKRATAENRGCYVRIDQGPLIVYKSFHKGKYPIATDQEIIEIGSNRPVRLGTYGDPAAVPRNVWDLLISKSTGHTGYSHQSKIKDSYSDICMHSVEDKKEAIAAWKDGKRTFRIIQSVDEIIKGKEVLCPASKEAGRKSVCELCKLCSGSEIKKRSVAIVQH